MDKDYKIALVVRDHNFTTPDSIAVECARAAIQCLTETKLRNPELFSKYVTRGQNRSIVLRCSNEGRQADLFNKAVNEGMVATTVTYPTGMVDLSVLGVGPDTRLRIDKITGHLKRL
ncbi:hypothetical protein ACOME3_008451 [Neoechinorhynchus agilis]